MSSDPVIIALEAALAQQPDARLRLALGERFAALDQHQEALGAFTAALAEDPTSVPAISGAASAAEALGLAARAAGYRQLLLALGGSARPEAPVVPLSPARPAAGPQLVGPEGEVRDHGAPVLQLVPGGAGAPDAERTTFADVGGLDHVKKRVEMAFLAPLRNPDLFRAYGKEIRGGLLLYGPPGCGKTHLARATAGEVGARFTSIGIVDVLDMWYGNSEKQLHELFETARRQSPVVLFLDELDALGQKRANLRSQSGRNLVNQLLVELDGLDSRAGVYVLAATNHPWDIDPALKRPGRFDRTLWVPPPDAAAREAILRRHMAGKPCDGLDFAALAGRTDQYSGADLVHLADSATEHVLAEALEGRGMRPVRMLDFERALKEVRPSIGPWLEVAKNYALYANEGGAYDDLAAWLKGRR